MLRCQRYSSWWVGRVVSFHLHLAWFMIVRTVAMSSVYQRLDLGVTSRAGGPHEMPPKPRQLRAPQPKQSGNAFQALVDLPEDGSDPTFDGRDGIVDGTDDNTVVIANPRDSGPPASQQLDHNESVEDNIVLPSNQINDCEAMHYKNQQHLYDIEMRVMGLSNNQQQDFEEVTNKVDNLLQEVERRTSGIGDEMESAFQTVLDKLENLTKQVDKMATEEVALRKAYRQSNAETAALKATVDTLTKQLDERIVIPAPPLPDPATSPSAMEEMTVQLSHVQHDIQDVLEAVRNPPGKRKRWGSD
jgi:ribosomal protein L14E/L6E/L27E